MYNIKKRITSLAIAILILVMALPINAT